MVERLENWPKLLSDYLAERKDMPFQWGVNDCMAFTCGAVERLTGHSFYPEFSDYHDEETAKELLARNDGVIGIVNQCLGPSHSLPLEAQRGDVVIVKLPEITGGIVDDTGQRIAVVTPNGLIRMPLKHAVQIWSY